MGPGDYESSWRDRASLDTVRAILERHIMLEIYLKQREIQIANEQIAFGEEVMQKLYALIINGDAYIEQIKMEFPALIEAQNSLPIASSNSSRASSMYSSPRLSLKRINESQKTSANQSPSSAVSTTCSTPTEVDAGFVAQLGPARTTRDRESRASLGRTAVDKLYARREDGSFVVMRCTECCRTNFSSMQGFVNHCRLAHKIEYPTHEAAILRAGVLVPSVEVPLNHPVRKTPWKNASYNTGKPWEQVNALPTGGPAASQTKSRIFIKEESLIGQINIHDTKHL